MILGVGGNVKGNIPVIQACGGNVKGSVPVIQGDGGNVKGNVPVIQAGVANMGSITAAWYPASTIPTETYLYQMVAHK